MAGRNVGFSMRVLASLAISTSAVADPPAHAVIEFFRSLQAL